MSSDIEKNIKIFKRVTSIKEIDWYRVSIKSLLPESFIHDNMDFLDWAAISRYQKLSIPFIINHDKQVDWYFIVKKYDLPEVMITHYYEQFDAKTRALLEDDEDVSYYTDSKKKKTKEPKKSTIEDTLELWKQNLSIYEIAKQRKLTPQTIYNHFTKLIQMEIVQLSDILAEDKISELKAAFKDFKGESLGELKEIHGDKFSWDELRLYKASLG